MDPSPTMLIGEVKEPLPPSKTKDNVDHVGLSPPPVQSKVSTKSLPET